MVDNVGEDSAHEHKILREPQLHFCGTISSQLQKAWVLICWNLLRQESQRLLVVKKNSRQFQKVWEDKISDRNWVELAGKGVKAEFSYKSTKQACQSGRDNFTNISCQ